MEKKAKNADLRSYLTSPINKELDGDEDENLYRAEYQGSRPVSIMPYRHRE